MKIAPNEPVIFDANGKATSIKKLKGKPRAFLSGFKGANDDNLADWAFLPVEINTLLRNDLRKLRARSRDLARNDDTAKRFLNLLKQNVLGHSGIRMQAKNRLKNNKPDKAWNDLIEREWGYFSEKRRRRGRSQSPSVCGRLSMRQFAWLALWNRAIDGESFIQILRGFPHNRHGFGLRFLNPDLLDSGYNTDAKNGNRIEMGIELDEFDAPVAYHFSTSVSNIKNQERIRVPADQVIHDYRMEYVGQLRGIPDFATIMHKQKMLNGVHEAIVVGWRVAAAKMGFFKTTDTDVEFDAGEYNDFGESVIDATPGTFEKMPPGVDISDFNPDYPNSTYESGHKVFMQQLSNGLNVSSPTLSNDYSSVNYSSLRQALLEDREGWRCIQADMCDGFYQPLFDEWYDWGSNVTRKINVPESKRVIDPIIEWQPRGWPWVDPLKEVNAQEKAVENHFRTRQSVMAETSGADFHDTIASLAEEKELLDQHGLTTPTTMDSSKQNIDEPEKDKEE